LYPNFSKLNANNGPKQFWDKPARWICRSDAMASGSACNPLPFEPMIISIVLAQQKKLMKLEQMFNGVKKDT